MLPSLLGFLKDSAGTYAAGFGTIAVLFLCGLTALLYLKNVWRRPGSATRLGERDLRETDNWRRFMPNPSATTVDTFDTHCPYCALQCGMTLAVRDEQVTVLSRNFSTNKGGLCQKGWFSAELLRHPERLRQPLVRPEKGGRLREASWEEAIGRVADAIETTQLKYGRNAIGVFGGGGLTHEKAYTLGKFARVALRTSQIDYNGRFCMSSAAAASIKAFGIDRGPPFPLADIPHANTILLVGSRRPSCSTFRHSRRTVEFPSAHLTTDSRWRPAQLCANFLYSGPFPTIRISSCGIRWRTRRPPVAARPGACDSTTP